MRILRIVRSSRSGGTLAAVVSRKGILGGKSAAAPKRHRIDFQLFPVFYFFIAAIRTLARPNLVNTKILSPECRVLRMQARSACPPFLGTQDSALRTEDSALNLSQTP
ncbi:MAG TPA: hypothetical protein VKX17_27875 [Planctomycetota bacterium]|nr:hypothetical protein [Planctomycetota bacterium]